MKYIKRNAEVDAIQWTKPGDHPLVKAAGPTLHQQAGCYYIEGMASDHGGLAATAWLSKEAALTRPVTKGVEHLIEYKNKANPAQSYFRAVYPFYMYNMKGTKVLRPLDLSDAGDALLLEDWHLQLCQTEGRNVGVAPYGNLDEADKNGRRLVFPYDWIVTEPDGRLEIVDGKKFGDLYEIRGG